MIETAVAPSPRDNNASTTWAARGHVVINQRAAKRLRFGHPWVYDSDIISRPKNAPAGFVTVADERGRPQGMAMYSPASTITLRLFSDVTQPPPSPELVEARLRGALARRERLLSNADAYRLVHGEADFLPGVFVDRYDDCVVVQTTCGAADTLLETVCEQLLAMLDPRALVVRNDAQTRNREKLPREVKVLRGGSSVLARYHEGALVAEVDLLADQKTGSFLDQVHNHVRAGDLARGEVMDCFTYHGGFALQMARNASHVTAYDISATALGRAKQNADRAGISNVDFCEADVFDVLPELHRTGKRFDTIVLDPPAFASTKRTEEAAMRAYKEINLRAMKLLRPNSLLISCSCSGRVRADAFDAMLHAAARDARRYIHIVESHTAGPDHPVLAGVPETDYLKCRVLMVL